MRALAKAVLSCGLGVGIAACEGDRIVAPSSVALVPGGGAQRGACSNDAKLLNGGPTAVFGEGAGTWWGLTVGGMREAGLLTVAQQLAYLNSVLGTSFPTLAGVKGYLLQSLAERFDLNGNGYVCAFDLLGIRAYNQDPLSVYTTFRVSDDRLGTK